MRQSAMPITLVLALAISIVACSGAASPAPPRQTPIVNPTPNSMSVFLDGLVRSKRSLTPMTVAPSLFPSELLQKGYHAMVVEQSQQNAICTALGSPALPSVADSVASNLAERFHEDPEALHGWAGYLVTAAAISCQWWIGPLTNAIKGL